MSAADPEERSLSPVENATEDLHSRMREECAAKKSKKAAR